jgi:hypothetical protein
VPVKPRYPRVASTLWLVWLVAACGGDGPTGPGLGQSGLRVVAGAGVNDTVDTQPLQALVVEVRGEGGGLARGTVVRFQSQPTVETTDFFYPPAVYVCALAAPTCGGYYGDQFITDTTDANGRAKVTVRLGHATGMWFVRLTVPELGLADSAAFTIKPGAVAGVLALAADTALDVGATATLRGHVVDRYNNPRTETTTMSAGPGSAITLDAAAGIVTAREMGTQWLFTRYNSFVDSTSVRVVPSGRLVVWSSDERVVRLVNINGSDERTLVSNVASDLGAFPQFDPTRQRITLHAGSEWYGGPPNHLIIIDTAGSARRDIGPAIGFSTIMATRSLADGSVLVVAQRSADASHPGFSLWRVATDNTITFVVALPELEYAYGGADISHSGTRVAYVAGYPSTYPPELRVLDVSTGSTTLIEANGNSPRWSAQDDRVAYLFGNGSGVSVAVVANADGTVRRVLGNGSFSPGLTWSPDGTYVIGRSGEGGGLRLLRVSDGANVMVRFSTATGCCHDYWQPDWR